jgi:hypothetical protein
MKDIGGTDSVQAPYRSCTLEHEGLDNIDGQVGSQIDGTFARSPADTAMSV